MHTLESDAPNIYILPSNYNDKYIYIYIIFLYIFKYVYARLLSLSVSLNIPCSNLNKTLINKAQEDRPDGAALSNKKEEESKDKSPTTLSMLTRWRSAVVAIAAVAVAVAEGVAWVPLHRPRWILIE